MFPKGFFAKAYFAGRYYAPVTSTVPVVPPVYAPGSGGGRQLPRRRRPEEITDDMILAILLADEWP